jgi:hypothetical protein
MMLAIFVDPADSQRTIAVSILGDDSPSPFGGAVHSIARGHQEGSDAGANIATDGKLVWMRYERDSRSHLTWRGIDGARRYTVSASRPADLETMLDALARAAGCTC